MSGSRVGVSQVVDRLLSGCADAVSRTGESAWRLSRVNGNSLDLDARISQGWLVLESHELPMGDPWQLLVANSALPGAGRFVLDTEQQALLLRAEIPLDRNPEEVGLTGQILAGFEAGMAFANGGPPIDPVNWDGAVLLSERLDLGALCCEGDWPARGRSDGTFVVELSHGRGRHQAVLRLCSASGALIRVDLVDGVALDEICRSAVAVLLLLVTGRVRGVRAVVRHDGDEPAVCLEWWVPETATADTVGHGLSALAVACELCAPEVGVLTDPVMAQRYLEIQVGLLQNC